MFSMGFTAFRGDGVFFGCVDRGDQDSFDFHAVRQNGLIGIITAFDQKFEPIFRFGAFFQRDMQFGHKVRFALRIKGFADICANAGSGTQKLADQSAFAPRFPQCPASADAFQRERFGFYDQRTFGHTFHIQTNPYSIAFRFAKSHRTSSLFTIPYSLVSVKSE